MKDPFTSGEDPLLSLIFAAERFARPWHLDSSKPLPDETTLEGAAVRLSLASAREIMANGSRALQFRRGMMLLARHRASQACALTRKPPAEALADSRPELYFAEAARALGEPNVDAQLLEAVLEGWGALPDGVRVAILALTEGDALVEQAVGRVFAILASDGVA